MRIIATILVSLLTIFPKVGMNDKNETHYESSEQAIALMNCGDEYLLFINELNSSMFGYQYRLCICIEDEWIEDHGVDAKQGGEMDMIMEYHNDCECELWYIVVDENLGDYDFTLYLHADGTWHTFYGYLG